MKIRYLGTAAAEGWPAPFCHCPKCEEARRLKGKNYRSRPQILVNDDLLMDFGPDTWYHALLYEIDMDRIKTVLVTHSHSDHFYPLEVILRARPYAYGQSEEAMVIYGNERCREMFDETATGYEAPDNMESYVQFKNAEAFSTFTRGGYEILPLKAIHDRRENCLLYAVRCPDGRTFLYGNDTGEICKETWEAISDWHFDLVSLDCTMGTGPSCAAHLGLADDGEIRRQMLAIGCADENTVFVVTHFSHGCAPLHEELEKLASEEGFVAAWDGMEVELP